MIETKSYAAQKVKEALGPLTIQRREPGEHDVLIDIAFCGVCHSDIHQARDEWGGSAFPMVPGHEIAGKVSKIGSSVKKFKVGDSVGVGCFVDTCRECESCKEGLEQYCSRGMNATYNGYEKDGKTPTYGGYSTHVTVDENYVVRIPDSIPLDKAAPLLCAGITTYSPLRHWKVKAGDKVAIVGLGGLGHMGVKIAAAMGAEVTVISTSDKKKYDAMKLGAKHFLNSTDPEAFKSHQRHFDFILNTVSANIDLNAYLSLVKRDGTMVLVGRARKAGFVERFSFIDWPAQFGRFVYRRN